MGLYIKYQWSRENQTKKTRMGVIKIVEAQSNKGRILIDN